MPVFTRPTRGVLAGAGRELGSRSGRRPMLVEAITALVQYGSQLCDGAEAAQPEPLLLRGADAALGAPRSLTLA